MNKSQNKNRNEKLGYIGFHVPVDIKATIKVAAEKNGRSMAKETYLLMLQGLRERENEGKNFLP